MASQIANEICPGCGLLDCDAHAYRRTHHKANYAVCEAHGVMHPFSPEGVCIDPSNTVHHKTDYDAND